MPNQFPQDSEAEASVLGAAIIDRSFREEALRSLSLAHFVHPDARETWATLEEMHEAGLAVDEKTVAQRLEVRMDDARSKNVIFEFIHEAGSVASARPQVRRLQDLATRRHILGMSTRIEKAAANGSDLSEVVRLTEELAATFHLEVGSAEPAPDLQTFLQAGDAESFDWCVRGVLERGDRMIVTGREGAGKSLLLAQIAVMSAAGLHPFGAELEQLPIRVLLVDLENPEAELRRRFRSLYLQAGDRLERDRLFIRSRAAGLDLLTAEDQAWLESDVVSTSPDLVIIGPVYKMADGDPGLEKDVKPVARFLDRLRTKHDCAVVLEAHIPHDARGRPYGWSGWRRWPEIGVELKETGLLQTWRPGRHETPGLPPALQRGGTWPFSRVTRPREVLWARIAARYSGQMVRPSQREIADALEVSLGQVNKVLQEHGVEWEEMFDE